jgi:chromosome segregation ATPase
VVSFASQSDDETARRLPAARVPPRQRTVRYVEPDELLWHEEIRSRLRSLATAVTVALIIAVTALGVALWTLLRGEDDKTGASVQRVAVLEERLQELESQMEGTASRDGLAAVREQQRLLARRLESLNATLDRPADDVEAMRTAIDATRQAVEQLGQRIEYLEQRSSNP